MSGPGYRFVAPRSWPVSEAGRTITVRAPGEQQTFLSTTTYRLGTAYTPDRFDEAAKELDGVAAKLAKAAGGSVTSSETTTVDGRRIRAYRFDSHPSGGGDYEDRVGFVLAGKREVQLLCQAPAGSGDPDGGCSLLFSSFSLTSAS